MTHFLVRSFNKHVLWNKEILTGNIPNIPHKPIIIVNNSKYNDVVGQNQTENKTENIPEKHN